MPNEESFPAPLEYIDADKRTNTTLVVLLERRIFFWNIANGRDPSEPWTGFTQFTISSEKPPDGFMWSGERQQHQGPIIYGQRIWSGMTKGSFHRKTMLQC